MYLKRIEIHGFKSFAQKTTIDFLESSNNRKSITAIVGPNGSGKSNISDAIRWVMGEQSMKHLRGKKSSDIIFSGSDTKGQMSMASVTLVLDNTDRRADIDFDELLISRKLYRTGDSEYIINGKTVRLLDVQLLLAKAQFGHGSYSVVGQGMIDRLLLQSAEERKSFFDEAVGIKEFQMKRRQAWLKLMRSREHVAQADLLLQEISPRLKSLSRQVKKLEQRQEIEINLQESQETYFVTLWSHYSENHKTINKRFTEVSEVYNTKQKELETLQLELADLARQASRSELFEKLQKTHDNIVKEKNELERKKAILQGKLQTEYSKAGKQQLSWLESKLPELTQHLSKICGDLLTNQQEQEKLEIKTSDLQKQIDNLQIERAELRTNLSHMQQKMLEGKSKEHLWQLGGLRAVESVLSNQRQFGKVYGAVAQLGSVEKQYQLALDVAAGAHLTSLVVQDDSVAQKAINFLRQERLGIATFLPINKIRPRIIPHNAEQYLGLSGVIGFAVDLIKFDQKLEDIFSFIFGSTLVVESMEVARSVGIGKIRMVTLDGDMIETSGRMRGGYHKKRSQDLSFSQGRIGSHEDVGNLDEQISDMQKEYDQDEIKILEIKTNLSQEQMKLGALKERYNIYIEQRKNLESEIAGLEQEKSLNTMSPDEYSDAMSVVTKDQEKIDSYLAEKQKELEKIQVEISIFNQKEEEKKQRIFALQDAMQVMQTQMQELSEKRHLDQVELAKLETKIEDLENDIYRELKTEISQVIKRGVISISVPAVDELQQKIQKLKYQLSLIGGIDEEVVEEYKETKQRHDDLSGQLEDLNKAINDLENLIEELDSVMKKKHNHAFKQIKKEFARYFSILFDGGNADLVEVYGYEKNLNQEDLEQEEIGEAGRSSEQSEGRSPGKKILIGVDVVACPPGKKIKNINMLSGGERTMASIALICAILHTNPSPFVVLDEVEAALDEANSNRLNTILQELAVKSQFILITHNRATMHTADTLYGVTMGRDGMSKLVSVDVR